MSIWAVLIIVLIIGFLMGKAAGKFYTLHPISSHKGKKVINLFARQVSAFPFVESIWAGEIPGGIEIWTIVNKSSTADEMYYYLMVGDVESNHIRQKYSFITRFHTTTSGKDLKDYMPQNFVKVYNKEQ